MNLSEWQKFADEEGIEIHFIKSTHDIEKMVDRIEDVQAIKRCITDDELKNCVKNLMERGQLYAIDILKRAGWDLIDAKNYVINLKKY